MWRKPASEASRWISRSVGASFAVAVRNVMLIALGRDFRELLTNDLRRFDHSDAFLDAFLDRPRLEPAVGMRPELVRRHVTEALADTLCGLVHGLRLVRVHVDDPDRELLREGIALEQVEPA